MSDQALIDKLNAAIVTLTEVTSEMQTRHDEARSAQVTQLEREDGPAIERFVKVAIKSAINVYFKVCFKIIGRFIR